MILTTALLSAFLTAPAHAEEAPTYGECTVVVPSITVAGERIANGQAFLATAGERTLVVSSIQVLGPAGGRAEQLDGAAARKGFEKLVARDAFTNKECGRAKRMLDIASAPADLGTHSRDDVVAFALDKSLDSGFATTVKPLKLAAAAPAKGDPVWLATRSAKEERVLRAKVADVNDNFVFYDFVDVKPDHLVGSVGGPVMNAKGEVVGLHVSAGQLPDGTLFGAANPVTSLKKHLAAELLPEKAAE